MLPVAGDFGQRYLETGARVQRQCGRTCLDGACGCICEWVGGKGAGLQVSTRGEERSWDLGQNKERPSCERRHLPALSFQSLA